MKKETLFRQKLRKKLEELPDSWWETIQQKTIHGTPDLIGCVKGRFIGIEIKAEAASTVHPLQARKLSCIRDAGGIGLIVYPENMDEVLNSLRSLGC
jgi:hypothetical protein